ncbi:Zinc finger, SWIM-type [Phytophthora cactorum]|nr:Zinc finger, SWIM-type [Phytophthora cactorum]
MFKKQVRAAAQCTARKSTENIFYVDDAAVSVEEGIGECSDSALSLTEPRADSMPRTYMVDLDTGLCSHCVDRQHLQLPCRHIIAALYNLGGNRRSTSGSSIFPSSVHGHRVWTSFQHAAIILPFVPALLSESLIQPPPLYNQAGTRSRNARRDVATARNEFLVEENQNHRSRTNSKRNRQILASTKHHDEIRGHQKRSVENTSVVGVVSPRVIMLQIARIDPMEPSTVISNPVSTSWVVAPSNCINAGLLASIHK